MEVCVVSDVTWLAEGVRFVLPTDEVDARGKEKVIPVTLQRLWLTGEMIVTDKYKVTRTVRKGKVSYTAHRRLRVKEPPFFWLGKSNQPEKWQCVERFGENRGEFVAWLARQLGSKDEAVKAAAALDNAEPTRRRS